jgi:hypothetical protein
MSGGVFLEAQRSRINAQEREDKMALWLSRRRRLPPSRRLVCDLLHFARRVPLFPLERSCGLGELAELRQRAPCKISWSVLFLKAYGLVAMEYAQLRQAYLSWPWPHLYEHPHNVALLAINRADSEGDRLYWGRFIQPEQRTLVDLQTKLNRYKSEPPRSVFRTQRRLSRLPTLLRRSGWWLALNLSGAQRARLMGTFGMSTLAGQGAVNRFHPTCLSTSLTYGPMDASGQVLVTLLYDHRIADGNCIAAALADLEVILRGPIASEVKSLYDGKRACA